MNPFDLDLINPDQLPPQLRQLVRCIGLPETLVLLDAKGGTQLHIPDQASRAHLLAVLLKPESVAALIKAYGGQRLELPKCDKVVQQLRNHAICSARSEYSASTLAREFNLTRRQIINISKCPPDDNQCDLLDFITDQGDTPHG